MAALRSLQPVEEARALLEGLRGTRPAEPELSAHTLALAELLQRAAEAERTRVEAGRANQLARLMADPNGAAFTTLLTDRAYRSAQAARVSTRRGTAPGIGLRISSPAFGAHAAIALRRPIRSLLGAAIARAGRALQPPRRALCGAVALGLTRSTRAGGARELNQLGDAVLGEREAASGCKPRPVAWTEVEAIPARPPPPSSDRSPGWTAAES